MQRILIIYFFIMVSIQLTRSSSKQDEQFGDDIMNSNYKPGEPGTVILAKRRANFQERAWHSQHGI